MYPAMNLISSLKAGNLRWKKPGETLKIFLQTRKIYSLTKKWDRYLTTEKKKEIETFWASKIKQPSNLDEVNSDKKYYVLSMFPYPSGKLHMGHVRVYTISDSLSRFHKMNGKEVLHPMGWDAFGLPAENAALDRGVSPADWTVANIGQMKQQLEKLGCDFEWDREIATCSPDYYRWTQYLFVQLFKQGLAYQQEALVNWDPVDKTVLADEQVDAEGRSWRSGAKVEKVLLKQWFVRTTSFAESLVQGLDDLNPDDWRDIIQLQKHWLGECNGYRFEFQIEKTKQAISVWTAHPEDLRNVSFLGIKPGHILDTASSEKTKLDQSKSLNFFATNPLTGANIPVIVTDELDYAEGTDSMLGVPSRDPKALDIAQQFKLKIAKSRSLDENQLEEERAEISNRALEEGWGGYKTSSKLRDWLISRQRYWGTPIPIIHCKNCGAVPVPEENLPVELPVGNTTFSRGKSGLKDNEEWKKTDCPRCTAPATRETDTMDTFVDSSWYFLRYTDPRNQNAPFDIQKAAQLMPVDMYIGGKEHAVLHLYYARFISHFLYSLGWLKQREPFRRLLVQGMVMGQTFQVKGSGKYLKHEEVDFSGKKPVEKGTGKPVTVTWEKMSKSKYNGVEPESVWDEHGIDTTRLLILANFTPRSHRHWSSDTFPGVLNWQTKLWSTITKFVEQRTQNPDVNQISRESFDEAEKELWELRNACVFHVTHNYSEFQLLSVAIARLQALTGSIKNFPAAVMAHSVEYERTLGSLLILMAPLAPHFTSELWTAFTDHALKKAPEIDWDKPVLQQKWPAVDKEFSFGLSCQVNGEEMGLMKMSSSQLLALNQEAAVDLVLQQEFVLKHCDKDKVKNTIFEVLPGPQARVNLITEKRKKEKKEKKQKKKDSEATNS